MATLALPVLMAGLLVSGCGVHRESMRIDDEAGACLKVSEIIGFGGDAQVGIAFREAGTHRPSWRYTDLADRHPGLTEATWDGNRVAVLICDSLASMILIGFDRSTFTPLSSDIVNEMIEGVLRTRYRLSEGDLKEFNGEAIRWACEAPVARVRYEALATKRTLRKLDPRRMTIPR